MALWTLDLPANPAAVAAQLAAGRVLALELDPRRPGVVLAALEPGLGDAQVGQRVVFRQWLGASGDTPVSAEEVGVVLAAAHAWLDTVAAGSLLRTVSEGYTCSRMWSGGSLGHWSPQAWAAAQAVVAGVVGAMEAADAGQGTD